MKPSHAYPLIISALVLLALASPAAEQELNRGAQSLLNEVKFDQQLGAQLPLETLVTDEDGKEVPLQTFFKEKPVLLAFVYHRCPMLCNQVLTGMVKALRAMSLKPGQDFDIIALSIDPNETRDMTRAAKKQYVSFYNKKHHGSGWHFLRGSAASITTLTERAGFKYVYDPETQQYSHASGIIAVTPDGRLSRYFYGIEYSARDVRLGLIEASSNKIGTAVDQILLFCFAYDASTGKYSLAIVRTLQALGGLTVLAVGSFIYLSIRRERVPEGDPTSALAAERGAN